MTLIKPMLFSLLATSSLAITMVSLKDNVTLTHILSSVWVAFQSIEQHVVASGVARPGPTRPVLYHQLSRLYHHQISKSYVIKFYNELDKKGNTV